MSINNSKTSSLRRFLPLLTIFVLLTVLGLAFWLSQNSQEIRQKAASSTGTATITLEAPATPPSLNESQNLPLVANIGSLNIDGFQVVATFSGIIPNNLAFQPTNIDNLILIHNSLSDSPQGKVFRLAYVTQNPAIPFQSTTPITLGSFTFIPTQPGELEFFYDNTLSIITQNQTTTDILKNPLHTSLSFVLPTPTQPPLPTPTPTPIVEPTPDTCVSNQPSITINPSSISTPAGEASTFAFTITNNDVNCPPSSFAFNLSTPPAFNAVIGMPKSPVTIAANGASYNNSVHITTQPTTASNTYDLNFTATKKTPPLATQSATFTLNVLPPQTSSCIRQSPILTLNPQTQTGDNQKTLIYTATLQSLDSAECDPLLYNLSSQVPNSWTSSLSSSSISLAPNTTYSFHLNATPPKTQAPGSYPVSVSAASSNQQSLQATSTYVIPNPPPLENLLQNPSFEVDTEKNFIPDFWTAVAFGRNGFVDCSVAQQGSCSLILSRSQYYPIFGLGRKTVRQRINVTANVGDATMLNLYYRLKGASVKTRGDWHIKLTNVYTNGTTQSVVRNLKTNGQALEHEFQNLQMSIIAKRNLRSVIVEFSYNMNQGALWIDNTRLYINRVTP